MAKQLNPISGPMPLDEFKTLVSLPYGRAIKKLRKYDPLLGYPPGTKIKWTVTATREQEGYAEVKAESLEEAKKLAANLRTDDFQWDDHPFDADFDIQDVTAD